MYRKKSVSAAELFVEEEHPSQLSLFQKKGAVIAIIFSVCWFLFSVDYLLSSGWWAGRAELSPAEFSGGICGLFLPIVIAGLVAAYFDRTTQWATEAATLQSYLNQLVYPTEEGAVYTQTLTDTLRTQIKEFKSVFEQVQNQTQQVRDDLKGWITDLSKVINHVDTQTIEAVKEMAGHIHALTEATQIANEQAEQASTLFAEQAAILQRVTKETVSALDVVSNKMSENTEEIQNTVHAIETANARTEVSLETAGKVVHVLQDNTLKIEKAIDSYEESTKHQNARLFGNLEKVLSVFKAHGAILDQEVEKTTNRLKVVESNLIENARQVATTIDMAITKMNDVGVVFDNNADKIKETTDVVSSGIMRLSSAVSTQARVLDKVTGRHMQQKHTDDFMKEGKLILDRLQSFAIDMARIFTPKAEENLWQRYNAGDKAVFMRHIKKEISSAQAKKIKDLLKSDAEFRLAVSRYMAEFEGMMQAARGQGEDNFMLSVLIGSDVGRLYMVLADMTKKGK